MALVPFLFLSEMSVAITSRVTIVYLTSTSLAAWLIQRGLLSPAAITAGNFAIQELEHHNRGFCVYRPAEQSIYVKQLRELDRPNMQCLLREAAFGNALANSDGLDWLRNHVPEFLDYDVRHHAVTIRLIPKSVNLHECIEQCGVMPNQLMSQLGATIASFRTAECDAILSSMPAESLLCKAPWILSFHIDQGAGFLSPQNEEFLNLLKNDRLLTRHFDELHDSWRVESLMHGDLKWNNVLTRLGGGTNSEGEWFIIDWEMVDRGDPLWDLATMVQCWWHYWILSTPPDQLSDFDMLRVQRKQAFDETRISLNLLWAGYVEAAKLHGPSYDDCRRRLVKMAAARMLQSVYELLNTVGVAAQYIELMIEMSRRVFADPDSMTDFYPGATSDAV
tara:strand:+ start:50060 stop:51235 length:1176 start_codon:yes stop_codon:yes gene_type:complete